MADTPNVVHLPPRPRLAVNGSDGRPPMTDRLAQVLSEICEADLLTLPSDGGAQSAHKATWRPLVLRLAHLNPDLAERAAALLEEAGW